MSGGKRRTGQSHRLPSRKPRRGGGCLVGLAAAVGAFSALTVSPLATAPDANADFDDLLQPIIDASSLVDPGIAGGTDPGSALASLDTLFDGWYQILVYTSLHDIAPGLFGADVPSSAAAYTSQSANIPDSFTVPMPVNNAGGDLQPVVSVSVGGGPSENVLVDTGAAGLIYPIWDINWFGITGLPTGFDTATFGGTTKVVELILPTTVTFTDANGDTVTENTKVAAELFAYPTNFNLAGPWTLYDYLRGLQEPGGYAPVGILGIGPNALGPLPGDIPTANLPGDLGHGVLIDQPEQELIFGDNPLQGGTVLQGAPFSDLKVQLDGGPITDVRGVIDSGGAYGYVPSSALGDITPTAGGRLPDGTTIEVFTNNGTPLYEYTVGSQPGEATSPFVVSNTSNMNTGNWPFSQEPVYISYSPSGVGQTIIGGTPISG
jgi:hypothetical protein